MTLFPGQDGFIAMLVVVVAVVTACTVAFEPAAFVGVGVVVSPSVLIWLLLRPYSVAQVVTAWTAASGLAALAVAAWTCLLKLPAPLAAVPAWVAALWVDAFEHAVFADSPLSSSLIWLLVWLLILPPSAVFRPMLCMRQG